MTDRRSPASPGASAGAAPEGAGLGRDRRLLYAGAIVVEAVVLLILWLAGRAFGS